jgi:2'-5' RNA ligase
MRCFVAIDFPAPLNRSVDDVVRRLKPLSRDVRWVTPGNLHLTLKFLGEVPETTIPAIASALKAVAESAEPFTLTVAGAGSFPNERRPNVLWAGITTPSLLLSLQSGVEDAMADLGFSKEQRCFTPHLTMGRVKGADGVVELMIRFRTFQNAFFGSIEVREIVLMQSSMKPTGAVYNKIGQFMLRQNDMKRE